MPLLRKGFCNQTEHVLDHVLKTVLRNMEMKKRQGQCSHLTPCLGQIKTKYFIQIILKLFP